MKSGEVSVNYLSDNSIDVIFVHYLKDKEVDFFYFNSILLPKIWMFWGADGFSLPLFYNKFLDGGSKEFLNKVKLSTSFTEYFKHKVKIHFNKLWNQSFATRKKLKVINQFNYIVPIVPGDFSLLSSSYKISSNFFHFNYVTDLQGDVSKNTEGNIFLGNSSSIFNNHLSILRKLNEAKLGSRKVYVPLSYGDQHYKKSLLDFIIDLKNPNIIPLASFIPFSEYTKIINSCDIMIMNHQRQQALGNIILGLINGCTIFMNESSTLYKFLLSENFLINTVGELDHMHVLSLQDRQHNSQIAKQVFGRERQLLAVDKLLSVFR
ncbi:hypothetical protein GCM10027454_19870 [Algoriphagus aestuariicola]